MSGTATLRDGTTVSFTGIEAFVIRFAWETRILMLAGERLVESPRPGDLVVTSDNGPQPIRWVGIRRIAGRGPLAPVRVPAGVLGNRRYLLDSPQHRTLRTGFRAQLYFGDSEVLAASAHLIGLAGIAGEVTEEVT